MSSQQLNPAHRHPSRMPRVQSPLSSPRPAPPASLALQASSPLPASSSSGFAMASPGSAFARPTPRAPSDLRRGLQDPQDAPGARKRARLADRSAASQPSDEVFDLQTILPAGTHLWAYSHVRRHDDPQQDSLDVLTSTGTMHSKGWEARRRGEALSAQYPTSSFAPLLFHSLQALWDCNVLSCAVQPRWQRLAVTDETGIRYFHYGEAHRIASLILERRNIRHSQCAVEDADVPDTVKLTEDDWKKRNATQIDQTRFWMMMDYRRVNEDVMRVVDKKGVVYRHAMIHLQQGAREFKRAVYVEFLPVGRHIILTITYASDDERYATTTYSSLARTHTPAFDVGAPVDLTGGWLESEFKDVRHGFYADKVERRSGDNVLIRREQGHITFVGFNERFTLP